MPENNKFQLLTRTFIERLVQFKAEDDFQAFNKEMDKLLPDIRNCISTLNGSDLIEKHDIHCLIEDVYINTFNQMDEFVQSNFLQKWLFQLIKKLSVDITEKQVNHKV